jgi:hypothetical protein
MAVLLAPRVTIVLSAVVLIAGGVGFGVRRHLAAARTAASAASARASVAPASDVDDVTLHVPHMPGSITLDGDTDDPGWTTPPGPARTSGFLLPNGAAARPYSETRLVWGDGYLYLCLYAADEDIRSRTDQPDGPVWLDDAFRVTFSSADTEWAIEVSPKAVVTDAVRKSGGAFDYSWSSGVHVSKELDGTLNDSSNEDEEWVIEMAVPFESIGLKGERGESIGFSVRRCDTPKHSSRVCASWGDGTMRGKLVLD